MSAYVRSTPETYLSLCSQLNAMYGYPSDAMRTMRALPLADVLPADDAGRVYLEVNVLHLLSHLLAGGMESVTEEEYLQVIPPVVL